MDIFISFLRRTVGQKIVVALTGLGLCLFVLIHMLGNLLILSGPKAYNSYAHKLHEFPLFKVFELGLFLLFAGHILLGLLLLIKNKRASRSVFSKGLFTGKKGGSFIHRLIWFQAGILLLFLVLHLNSFKFGPYYETLIDGKEARDIYQLVVETFKKPLYTIGYSLALLILFIHLLRGLTASFKSLGFGQPPYLSLIQALALIFSLVVTFGFLAPIWYIFFYL